MLNFQWTAKSANPLIVLERHLRAIQMSQDGVLPAYFLREPPDNVVRRSCTLSKPRGRSGM